MHLTHFVEIVVDQGGNSILQRAFDDQFFVNFSIGPKVVYCPP